MAPINILLVDDDTEFADGIARSLLNKPISPELFGGLIKYIRRRRSGAVMARPPR